MVGAFIVFELYGLLIQSFSGAVGGIGVPDIDNPFASGQLPSSLLLEYSGNKPSQGSSSSSSTS